MYNLTNVTAANNVAEILDATLRVSGGVMGGIMLFFIFLLLLLILSRFDFRARLIAAGFITSLIGMFMFNLNYIGWEYLIAPILILMGGVILYMFVD